jgi:hypothetical protein
MPGSHDETARNSMTIRPVEHARAHLAAEGVSDLDGTMATMVEPYFYEVWPSGLRMEGRDNARSYYEFHFSTLRPRMVASDIVGEWENDEGLVIERDVHVRDEAGDGVSVHRVLAIIAVDEHGVAGERIYASPAFHRLVFGDDRLANCFSPVAVSGGKARVTSPTAS